VSGTLVSLLKKKVGRNKNSAIHTTGSALNNVYESHYEACFGTLEV